MKAPSLPESQFPITWNAFNSSRTSLVVLGYSVEVTTTRRYIHSIISVSIPTILLLLPLLHCLKKRPNFETV